MPMSVIRPNLWTRQRSCSTNHRRKLPRKSGGPRGEPITGSGNRDPSGVQVQRPLCLKLKAFRLSEVQMKGKFVYFCYSVKCSIKILLKEHCCISV